MKAGRIGIDLRASGAAQAVAVDGAGRLLAWATASDSDSDAVSLAKQALRELSVRPKELRILLGSETAQVGVFTGESDPRPGQAVEALLSEGYEPLAGPAVADVSLAPGSWLVAACAEAELDALARGLAGGMASEPAFVVDQLLLARLLEPGTAVAEATDTGASVVALPRDAAPVARSLAATTDVEWEISQTLRSSRVESVRVLGALRESPRDGREDLGCDVESEVLPSMGRDRLPAQLELAWQLAVDPAPPELRGTRLDERRRSLNWGRRVAWAAMAAWLLAIVVFTYALVSWWSNRARQQAFQADGAAVRGQMERVRETVALAQEVRQLRGELARHALPWPRLAETLAELARIDAADVAWERLAIVDGELELEALAYGPVPMLGLEGLRQDLDRIPGIVNLAWEEAVMGERGAFARQVFRAKLREVRGPGSGPEQEVSR